MRKTLTLLLLFSFVTVLNSCHQELNEEKAIAPAKSVTISEAKEWFNKQIAPTMGNNKDVSSNVLWDLAFEHTFPIGETYVMIPILRTSKKQPTGPGNYKQVWIYKDLDNKMNLRVIEYVYDSSIPLKSLANYYSMKNFKGVMIVRDWDNNMVGGFICENGKIVKGIHNSSESVANARPASFIC